METGDSTGAGTVKPRAAASLTADIVARGRHRTQEYGEAGLWRGAKAPLPSEAPVRVTFPRSAAEQIDAVDESVKPSREPMKPSRESVAPQKPRAVKEPAAAAGSSDDLAPLLFVSVALFLAVFFVGLWFF